jgi:hypothetical protein
MNALPTWVSEIENKSGGKQVLLVEGKDDVTWLRHFLNQHRPGWDVRLHLAPAGGKQHVISGIAVHRPNWIGLVDHDEWGTTEVQNAVSRSPRLHVLPRFCLESYFCHPDELWSALPPIQQSQVKDDPRVIAEPIWAALPDWLAHGAMWRVLRQLYHETDLPAELESGPVTDENEIRRILQTWHDRLAPDGVIAQYHHELTGARRLSTHEQLTRYVHGKKFFNQVVVQTFDGLFSGRGADDWLEKFRDQDMSPPLDLKDLLDKILSQIV